MRLTETLQITNEIMRVHTVVEYRWGSLTTTNEGEKGNAVIGIEGLL
jgi:hypothetical protein